MRNLFIILFLCISCSVANTHDVSTASEYTHVVLPNKIGNDYIISDSVNNKDSIFFEDVNNFDLFYGGFREKQFDGTADVGNGHRVFGVLMLSVKRPVNRCFALEGDLPRAEYRYQVGIVPAAENRLGRIVEFRDIFRAANQSNLMQAVLQIDKRIIKMHQSADGG